MLPLPYWFIYKCTAWIVLKFFEVVIKQLRYYFIPCSFFMIHLRHPPATLYSSPSCYIIKKKLNELFRWLQIFIGLWLLTMFCASRWGIRHFYQNFNGKVLSGITRCFFTAWILKENGLKYCGKSIWFENQLWARIYSKGFAITFP